MPRFRKRYAISMVVWVEPDAPFLELNNGGNEDVVLELVKEMVYDLDDMEIQEIEVECLE